MTAETDLLPVAVSPYTDRILAAVRAQDCTDPLFQILDDYARANLAELQREVEGLRAEVAELRAKASEHRDGRLAALERAERLAEALRDAREYVVSELAAERAAFAGYEHCSNIASIEADLAKIDAALNQETTNE